MKTTVKALLDLYVKLGGSLTDTYDGIANGEAVGNYTLIPDCVEACAKKAGGSVTVDSSISSTSKNPVQNKAIYAALAAKADSTALPLVVTAELNSGTHAIENASATLAQVVQAAAAGRNVSFVLSAGTGLMVGNLVSTDNDNGALSADFITISNDSEDGAAMSIVSASSAVDDGAWKFEIIGMLPPYSSATAGKVLGVNNEGELEWVTP